jgi:metallo-beta-lactamase class B
MSPAVVIAVCLAAVVSAQAPGATASSSGQAPRRAADPNQDNIQVQRVAPFQVFDNLYFVGVRWVSSWLLKTSQGLILIDTLYPPFTDLLVENIKSLGFDPKDIRQVIGTHAHYDHMGNAAWLQQQYGTRFGMAEGDWQFLAASGSERAGKPRRDQVFKDGDTLILGDTTLKFYVMPSHTPGVLGIEFTVYDRGKPLKAFVQPPINADGAEPSVSTVARLAQIQGVQANVWVHPTMDPKFWERADTLKQRKPGDPHPFVDPGEHRARVEALKTRATSQPAKP